MDDLDERIAAVLDGTADAAVAADLVARLRDDAEVRRRWWAEVALRSHLRQELAAARSQASGRRLVVGRRRGRQRSRSSFRVWPALAALAALVIVGVGLWRMSVPTGPVPALFATEVGVEASGDRDLVLADGTRLVLRGARWRLDRADGARLTLFSGRLEAEVRPRPSDAPLVVATPHGDAVVVGTRLRLSSDDGATLLRVDHGVVRFAGAEVAAGQARLAGPWGACARTIVVDAERGPTLAEAAATLGPDEALILGPGVHRRGGDDRSLARITVAGAAGRPARIVAEPGTRPVLSAAAWDVLRVAGNHAEIRGLRFVGAASGEGNGLVLVEGADLAIRDCRFEGFGGDGMNTHRIDGLRIASCRFIGNGARSTFGQGGLSIFLGEGTGETVLTDLVCVDNRTGPVNRATGTATGGHGLLLGHDGGDRITASVRIEECLIAGNQGPGLTINDLPLVALRDCRLLANGSGPVGELRAQISATGDAVLRLSSCVLAADAGSGLLRIWDPARLEAATDCRVWGDVPPGPGFTALSAPPTWAMPEP